MKSGRPFVNRVQSLALVFGASLSMGCSLILGSGPLGPVRSVWDDCFVGRFVDPGTATLIVDHYLSDIYITGMPDPGSGAGWEAFSVSASVYDASEGDVAWRGPVSVFGPVTCGAGGCETSTFDAVDAVTGSTEVTVTRDFADVDADRDPFCIPTRSDRIALSFRFRGVGGGARTTVAIDAQRAFP